MILLIDNYDSFTYNLLQLAAGIAPDVRVVRNDALAVKEIEALHPSHILLSPGPGYPRDAGVCEEAVRCFAGKIPILGVCLGHQAICEVFGATITRARRLMHGKKSCIRLMGDPIFAGLPEKIDAARYHSLIARRDTVPGELIVIAEDDDIGEVMAVKHSRYTVYGLQFHPESVLTPQGEAIMRNFLSVEA
jgi:glutamine amidotransferase of anthranilate synthase or aminodeoxychorismate synthase